MYRFTVSWLHKAVVRLCAGLLTILGIKLSAFYFIGLLIVLGLHRDQLLGGTPPLSNKKKPAPLRRLFCHHGGGPTVWLTPPEP